MENFVKKLQKITFPHFVPFFLTPYFNIPNRPYQQLKLPKILDLLLLYFLLINLPYYY